MIFIPTTLILFPQNTGFVIPGISNLVNQELGDPECAKVAETILNQLSNGKGWESAGCIQGFPQPAEGPRSI